MTEAPESRERPRLHVVRDGEAPQPQADPGDWDLVTSHLAGDPFAFAELVKRHQRPVWRLALRFAHDPDEAEDLAQRTFLRVLDHVADLRPDQPFRAYLFRVAANLCKNHLRDRARLLFGVSLEVAAPEAEPLEAKERRVQLRTLLAKLPLRQRQIVTLRIDAELPFAEIASILSEPETRIKKKYYRLLERLQAQVEK